MRIAAVVGIGAALAIVVTAPLWSAHVFTADRLLSVVLLSIGLAGFCLHATLLGMLAGVDRWTQYGSLMVTDAAIRVAVAAAAFVLGWGLAGFLWATVAGSVAWLILLVLSPATREAARLTAAGSARTFLTGAFHSVAAAGASAVLIMGFPVLLKATTPELGAAGGVVILAVTLTRAPLLVPLTAMQGNLIAHFVDQSHRRLRALVVPAAAVTAIGGLGVLAAWWAGPWLLRSAFGPDYQAAGGSAGLVHRGRGGHCAAHPDRCGRRGGGPAPRVCSGVGRRHAGRGGAAAPSAGPGDPDRHRACCAGRWWESPCTCSRWPPPIACSLVRIDTPYPDVWVIVPAFNEASVITDVLADIRAVFANVVCVDDGSTDGTAGTALEAGAHLVRHPVNLGQERRFRPVSSTPATGRAPRSS